MIEYKISQQAIFMKEKKKFTKYVLLLVSFKLKFFQNAAYQNSINQNDIQKFELLGSHKKGKVDEKANKFVLPFKRKVKK